MASGSDEPIDTSAPAGIGGVRHSIAVASGKGGVGKSTVAVNLALALRQQGYRVGLLDADIYGPSIPTMLGIHGEPVQGQGGMVPLQRYGLRLFSIGFLIDEAQPVVWRGPLASRAINDFLNTVFWGELDYLIIDLPPGTGDPSITLAKLIENLKVVIVTTPQQLALDDVRKAIGMFCKVGAVPLGIVENMAYFQCEHSDEPIPLFGSGGGALLSREAGLPLLASLPLAVEISRSGDEGCPLMESHPDSAAGRLFRRIAEEVAAACEAAGEGEPYD